MRWALSLTLKIRGMSMVEAEGGVLALKTR
jgi:hypothetical protein